MENKKRLIDADELLRDAEDYSPITAGLADAYDIKCLVNAQPTIDAVEVVRCKDCNFWRRCGETNKGECDGMEVYGLMNADDYCSFGERKIHNA